jgi:ubiquinone/menaquinone biosynthesis C-methylase UbiE
MHSWNDLENAKLYDEFARKHTMYRETSRDLVELAQTAQATTVVDLACGTAVSTEIILAQLREDATVVAIDASSAMVEIAQRNVPDSRVQWVQADSSEVANYVTDADAIICNAAFWQMDMDATLLACSKALRPGGRFVFNIGRSFLMMRLTPEELRPSKPTFFQLIQAVAILDHGFAPPHSAATSGPRRLRGPLTPDAMQEMITSVGLILDATEEREYENPAEAQLDWISVPVFSDNVLPGMPHDQQLQVIRSAYERFDKDSVSRSRWLMFVTHRP